MPSWSGLTRPALSNGPEVVGSSPTMTTLYYSVAGAATSRKYGSTLPLSFTVIG